MASEKLKKYLDLRAAKMDIEKQMKSLQADLLDEIGDEPIIYNGLRISQFSKATYKFDHIISWVETKKELKLIEDIAKAQLRNNSLGLSAFDEGNGEEVEVAVVNYSKPSIKVEILK